jgi:hypothetical protein
MNNILTILNVSLFSPKVCEQVKEQLMAEGWYFITYETGRQCQLTMYVSKEDYINNRPLAIYNSEDRNSTQVLRMCLKAAQKKFLNQPA